MFIDKALLSSKSWKPPQFEISSSYTLLYVRQVFKWVLDGVWDGRGEGREGVHAALPTTVDSRYLDLAYLE